MTLTLVTTVVCSQVNVIVRPVRAESYDQWPEVLAECQEIANGVTQKVTLLSEHHSPVEFTPKETV